MNNRYKGALVGAILALAAALAHAGGVPLFLKEIPLSEAHTVLSQGDMIRITDSDWAAMAKQIRVMKLNPAAMKADVVTADGVEFKVSSKQCYPESCVWIGHNRTLSLLIGVGVAGDVTGDMTHADGSISKINNYAARRRPPS